MSILVTGVSSGLGHAMAAHLLDRGDAVLGLSRREPADLVAREQFLWRKVDLAALHAVAPAVRELVPHGMRLAVVVLNAGILGEIQDLERTSLPALREIMDVNVLANKVLLEALWERGVVTEQVVAISSGAAVKGMRGWGGYAISKAALNMLMQVYAAERPEVHFSALAPGLVDTAMQVYMRALPDTPEYASVARLKAAHGTPAMPDASTAAARLIALFPRLKEQPSGAFHDARQL